MALIVGVDQTDQIAEDNAVFVAKTRARQDDTSVARVLDMDGEARWQQGGIARFQRGVSVNTGTQIQTR